MTSERLASYVAEIPKTCSTRKDIFGSVGMFMAHGKTDLNTAQGRHYEHKTYKPISCQLAYRFGKSLLCPTNLSSLSPPVTLYTATRWILVSHAALYGVTQGDCLSQGP